MLETIRKRSDFVVDTSNTTGAQLKDRVFKAFTTGESRNITIYITSFGFKHGLPVDSDDVFDVRCFPNPYYDVNLRTKTGLDAPVYDYVFSFKECREFADKLYDMMCFLIPLYQKEGRNRLIINIGCTGGKHRSVSFAENLGKRLNEHGYDAVIAHRDIKR